MKTADVKRYLFIVILWICMLPSVAQKMSVAKFYMAEKDLTANTTGTTVFDQNGDKCALIKVETTQRGFTFDGGSLGITKTEEHPGEIWVYVPHGLKRITISHPQLGILRDYDLGLSVQKARTYILELTTDKVLTAVFDDSQTQILELNVFPVNAEVIINGMKEIPDAQGRVVKELSLGTYNCRVKADDYHHYEGVISIDNSNDRHIVNIALKQAFGYLDIIADSVHNGAEVFLDDNKIGTLPLMRQSVKSGTHKLVILKPLYLPYEVNFTVTDSTVYQLRAVSLKPNFAPVTINAVEGSSVWVDNEFKSRGTWTGMLELGKHSVECRKENHRTTSKSIVISSNNAVTFSCEIPEPIYGSIHVTSEPTNADVYIDDVKVGTTPYQSHSVLIGNRNIRLQKDGYKMEEQSVLVKERETVEVSKTMSEYNVMQLTSIPAGAEVYLNGYYRGKTPINILSSEKTEKVKMTLLLDGYDVYKEKIKPDDLNSEKVIKLKRKYISSNEFHIGANYRVGVLKGIEFNLGGYISNLNFEIGYIMSNDETGTIYWQDISIPTVYNMVTYKFAACTIRCGYGIRIGNRMRVTPQFGICHIVLNEEYSNDYPNVYADGAYTTCGTFAFRMEYSLIRHLGISLAPEYGIPINKSAGYEALSSIPDIEDQSFGFSFKGGLYLYF